MTAKFERVGSIMVVSMGEETASPVWIIREQANSVLVEPSPETDHYIPHVGRLSWQPREFKPGVVGFSGITGFRWSRIDTTTLKWENFNTSEAGLQIAVTVLQKVD